jgi:hypothetical protein
VNSTAQPVCAQCGPAWLTGLDGLWGRGGTVRARPVRQNAEPARHGVARRLPAAQRRRGKCGGTVGRLATLVGWLRRGQPGLLPGARAGTDVRQICSTAVAAMAHGGAEQSTAARRRSGRYRGRPTKPSAPKERVRHGGYLDKVGWSGGRLTAAVDGERRTTSFGRRGSYVDRAAG